MKKANGTSRQCGVDGDAATTPKGTVGIVATTTAITPIIAAEEGMETTLRQLVMLGVTQQQN